MSRLKLIDFLKLIASDIFPIEYDPNFNVYSNFRTSFDVNIHFGDDVFIRCNIANPILVPWYDETIQAISPVDLYCIDVWLDSSGIRNLYSEYIKEVKEHEPNNKSDISNT